MKAYGSLVFVAVSRPLTTSPHRPCAPLPQSACAHYAPAITARNLRSRADRRPRNPSPVKTGRISTSRSPVRIKRPSQGHSQPRPSVEVSVELPRLPRLSQAGTSGSGVASSSQPAGVRSSANHSAKPPNSSGPVAPNSAPTAPKNVGPKAPSSSAPAGPSAPRSSTAPRSSVAKRRSSVGQQYAWDLSTASLATIPPRASSDSSEAESSSVPSSPISPQRRAHLAISQEGLSLYSPASPPRDSSERASPDSPVSPAGEGESLRGGGGSPQAEDDSSSPQWPRRRADQPPLFFPATSSDGSEEWAWPEEGYDSASLDSSIPEREEAQETPERSSAEPVQWATAESSRRWRMVPEEDEGMEPEHEEEELEEEDEKEDDSEGPLRPGAFEHVVDALERAVEVPIERHGRSSPLPVDLTQSSPPSEGSSVPPSVELMGPDEDESMEQDESSRRSSPRVVIRQSQQRRSSADSGPSQSHGMELEEDDHEVEEHEGGHEEDDEEEEYDELESSDGVEAEPPEQPALSFLATSTHEVPSEDPIPPLHGAPPSLHVGQGDDPIPPLHDAPPSLHQTRRSASIDRIPPLHDRPPTLHSRNVPPSPSIESIPFSDDRPSSVRGGVLRDPQSHEPISPLHDAPPSLHAEHHSPSPSDDPILIDDLPPASHAQDTYASSSVEPIPPFHRPQPPIRSKPAPQRPRRVLHNRAYVSIPISEKRRAELIARGVYDAFRDDEDEREGRPTLRKRYQHYAAGSNRIMFRKEPLVLARPEEMPERFIHRPGPALMEPHASVLTQDRLLHTLGSYPCGWKGCGAVLDSEARLGRHVAKRAHAAQGAVHAEEVVYRCYWAGCAGPCFERVEGLVQHLRARHVAQRLRCPFAGCEMASPTLAHLQRHALRSHTSDTPLRPRADTPTLPQLPPLPPIPQFARSHELTTHPVAGRAHPSAYRQDLVRQKIQRLCYGGPEPDTSVGQTTMMEQLALTPQPDPPPRRKRKRKNLGWGWKPKVVAVKTEPGVEAPAPPGPKARRGPHPFSKAAREERRAKEERERKAQERYERKRLGRVWVEIPVRSKDKEGIYERPDTPPTPPVIPGSAIEQWERERSASQIDGVGLGIDLGLDDMATDVEPEDELGVRLSTVQEEFAHAVNSVHDTDSAGAQEPMGAESIDADQSIGIDSGVEDSGPVENSRNAGDSYGSTGAGDSFMAEWLHRGDHSSDSNFPSPPGSPTSDSVSPSASSSSSSHSESFSTRSSPASQHSDSFPTYHSVHDSSEVDVSHSFEVPDSSDPIELDIFAGTAPVHSTPRRNPGRAASRGASARPSLQPMFASQPARLTRSGSVARSGTGSARAGSVQILTERRVTRSQTPKLTPKPAVQAVQTRATQTPHMQTKGTQTPTLRSPQVSSTQSPEAKKQGRVRTPNGRFAPSTSRTASPATASQRRMPRQRVEVVLPGR